MVLEKMDEPVFTSRLCELLPPGTLDKTQSISFQFENLDIPYESYNGVNVRLR